jgi:hypothetical protein
LGVAGGVHTESPHRVPFVLHTRSVFWLSLGPNKMVDDNTERAVEVPVGLGQLEPILQAVSREYKIPAAMLRSRLQTATVLEARQLCYWLACKLTRLSKEEIGRVFDKGKTSVGLGVASIERLRESEPSVLTMSDRLLQELRAA